MARDNLTFAIAPDLSSPLARLRHLSQAKLEREMNEATEAYQRAISEAGVFDLNHDKSMAPINREYDLARLKAQTRFDLREKVYLVEYLGQVQRTAQGQVIALNPFRPGREGSKWNADHPYNQREIDLRSCRLWIERHRAEIEHGPAEPTDRRPTITTDEFYTSKRAQALDALAVAYWKAKGFLVEGI